MVNFPASNLAGYVGWACDVKSHVEFKLPEANTPGYSGKIYPYKITAQLAKDRRYLTTLATRQFRTCREFFAYLRKHYRTEDGFTVLFPRREKVN